MEKVKDSPCNIYLLFWSFFTAMLDCYQLQVQWLKNEKDVGF